MSDYSDRTPPQDLEAEQTVLGAMMMGDKEAIEDAMELLRGPDFYRPAHEQVYNAITHLHEGGNPVDPVTVADELSRRGELERLGGANYLHTLQSMAPIAANVGYHADIVREKKALRRVLDTTTRAAQGVYDGSGSDAVIDRAAADLDKIPLRTTQAASWPDVFREILDDLDSTEPPGMPVPWPELDRVIHGLRPGNVYMIAARPKVGKSLLAQAIAVETTAVHGKTALYFTLEMTRKELGYRIIADKGSIHLSHLIDRNLSTSDDVCLSELYAESAPWLLEIHDDAPLTMAQANGIVREACRRTDVGVAIFDYIGLMTARDEKVSREQQVSEMSRSLKVLAKKYNIPVVVLVQLNRGPENRPDKRPMAADMRDSGAQEQDATAVMLAWRDPDQPYVMKLEVALNRWGEQGVVVDLDVWGHYARITSPESEMKRKSARGAA